MTKACQGHRGTGAARASRAYRDSKAFRESKDRPDRRGTGDLKAAKAALLQWYRQDFPTGGGYSHGVAFDGANIWVANRDSGTLRGTESRLDGAGEASGPHSATNLASERTPARPLPASAPGGILAAVDLLVTDPVSGRARGLAKTVRRVLRAMEDSGVPYCVVGATALAVRGLPRMTRDLDLIVMIDDAGQAIEALRAAKLRAETPVGTLQDPEPMIVFADPLTKVEVDLLIAAGDPEATVCEQAPRATVFGTEAPVATLEQLLLLYLYSNQPKHLGDFAAIVTSGRADLSAAGRTLASLHPEMIGEWNRRVHDAQQPPPAPQRPAPRKRRR